MSWSLTSQELRDVTEDALGGAGGSPPGSPETRAFDAPPGERPSLDAHSDLPIPALPPPPVGDGPSDAYGMNTLGDLGDDAHCQPAARRQRTYLGEPGNPLAPENKNSKATLWSMAVMFQPAGPRGENLQCFAKPKVGEVGIPNPLDPTKPNICGKELVYKDASNCNKHLRKNHEGEWVSATRDNPVSTAGNALRQQRVAAVHGSQSQLPFMKQKDREAHNERFVLWCAMDLRPPHLNTHLGFRIFATGLNPGYVFVRFLLVSAFFCFCRCAIRFSHPSPSSPLHASGTCNSAVLTHLTKSC